MLFLAINFRCLWGKFWLTKWLWVGGWTKYMLLVLSYVFLYIYRIKIKWCLENRGVLVISFQWKTQVKCKFNILIGCNTDLKEITDLDLHKASKAKVPIYFTYILQKFPPFFFFLPMRLTILWIVTYRNIYLKLSLFYRVLKVANKT